MVAIFHRKIYRSHQSLCRQWSHK